MGQQVEFKTKPEVKIWEARRERLTRAQKELTYVRIGGEVFQVKGSHRRKRGPDHANLMHVLTGKYFLTDNERLLTEIYWRRIERLNEMEVLALVSK